MRLFCQKRGNFLTSRQKRVAEREAHVTLQETEALEHTIAKILLKRTARQPQKPVLQRAMIVTHVMNSLYYVEPLCKSANAGTFPISSFTIMARYPFLPCSMQVNETTQR